MTTKAVIIDTAKGILASFVKKTGADLEGSANEAFEEALKRAGLSREEIGSITATGFGRKSVPFAQETVTEIGCHSRGCYHYFREEITIVDIGGQDNKIIRLDAEGKRVGFKINRKCAAGTGAFLEEMAYRLDIPRDDLDGLARRASSAAEIGSYCTVFTATEVLDRIRRGEKIEEIVRGLFVSVVKRVLELGVLSGRVIVTGGVV
ncbi:MAG: acyl-CoA dehydratase activase, partial [Anaerolineae bacterium]